MTVVEVLPDPGRAQSPDPGRAQPVVTRRAAKPGAAATGERVESLLGQLRAAKDPRAAQIAEELVGNLVELYGAGLSQIVAVLEGDPAGTRLLTELAADPLVESLLLVHDLHPVDVDGRIQQALDGVRPYLGSHAGGVDYLGVDDGGMVHLRLEGSCNGCPSSTVTVRLTIEQAIAEAAPETNGVEVEGVAESPPSPLLQIGPRPDLTSTGESQAHGHSHGAASPAPAANEPDWVTVQADAWPAGAQPEGLRVAGLPVLACRLDDALYAYRDECPSCGGTPSAGTLAGSVLRCPGCGSRYDLRLAGVGIDHPDQHLWPVPLLREADGVRLAVGAAAVAR